MVRHLPGVEEMGMMFWRWSLLIFLLLLVTFAPVSPDASAPQAASFLRMLTGVLHLFQAFLLLLLVRLASALGVSGGVRLTLTLAAVTFHVVVETGSGATLVSSTTADGLAGAISTMAPLATLLLAWHALAAHRWRRCAGKAPETFWTHWEQAIQERRQA